MVARADVLRWNFVKDLLARNGFDDASGLRRELEQLADSFFRACGCHVLQNRAERHDERDFASREQLSDGDRRDHGDGDQQRRRDPAFEDQTRRRRADQRNSAD